MTDHRIYFKKNVFYEIHFTIAFCDIKLNYYDDILFEEDSPDQNSNKESTNANDDTPIKINQSTDFDPTSK